MIKQISFLSLVVFGLLFTASASAQGTVRVSMSDADREAFCAGASAVAPVAGETSVSSCCAKLKRQVSRLWAANGLRRRDIAALDARVSELEANGVSADDIEEAIAPLRARLDAMTAERDAAISELKVSLNGRMDELQGQLDALKATDVDHGQRIDALERQSSAVVVGLRANVLLLGSSDDADYAGAQFGLRLKFVLTPAYYMYLQPGMLVSGGDQRMGASVDVGVGRNVYTDGEYVIALEAGPALSALRLDSQLDAKQINTALSVGAAFHFPHGIQLGAALQGGVQFNSGDPRGVIGGVIGAGIDLN